jgi:hypothetical protein
MCGRYSITVDKDTIERCFNAHFTTAQQEFEPTYNTAPSQLLAIITTYAPNDIVLARWGFVPGDWHNAKIRPQNNARVRSGLTALAIEGPDGLSCAQFIGDLRMAERDEVGERLATMLQHAAASAESQTEVTLRNLQAQDEATKAQREAIEVQRKAAEAEAKAAEASIASAKAAEKAAVVAERNAKYMLWSVIVASISAIASAVSAYYSYWSAVHPR